jgi:pimeloyl-ACP methyl ester carboxylesterase
MRVDQVGTEWVGDGSVVSIARLGGMVSEFESFDGTRLSYEEEGEGSPVLLLHGLSSSTKGNWQDPGAWAALVAVGKRVVGLDARGHGRSDKPHEPAAYENEAMARDVGALLDHLDVGQTDLAGYSMGAATALLFATTDTRLRRLVLGGIGGEPTLWGSPEDGGRSAMPKRWLAGLEADDPNTIEDPVARSARRLFEARGNDLEAIAAMLRSNRKHLSADIPLGRVTIPTLVVCGDKDASPHPLAAALPNATAVVLDGDHEGVVVNPELAKVLAEFLSR